MAKTFIRRYTNTGNRNAKAALSIPAGMKGSFAIPLASEGSLFRLVIHQATGTLTPFSIELLDSNIPYPPGISAWNAGPTTGTRLEHYRVIGPEGPLDAGDLLESDQVGGKFANTDGTHTGNESNLYLVIIPQNSPDISTWDVTIGVEKNIG